MLSGVAIGEAAIAAGADIVSGAGAPVSASISDSVAAGDSATALAAFVGALVEAFALDSAGSASSGASIGDSVFEVVGLSAMYLADGLWVTSAAEPMEWHVALAGPNGWTTNAVFDDVWIKQ